MRKVDEECGRYGLAPEEVIACVPYTAVDNVRTPSHIKQAEMGEEHKTILAVSPDRQIARFRHEALTEAGFYVISVHSEAAARYEIHFGRCGILLLCHKLNRLAREALANDFHTMCDEPFIVSFLAHERDHYPPQTHVRMLHSRDLSHLVATLRQRLAA